VKANTVRTFRYQQILAQSFFRMPGTAKCPQENSGLTLGYCLALLVAVLTSYYAYSYDMTLLIIPPLLPIFSLSGGFLD
jgi:hypothetical protein